jgi:taurine transport system permease protein
MTISSAGRSEQTEGGVDAAPKMDRGSKHGIRIKPETTLSLLSVIVLLGLWFFLTRSIITELYFPSPESTILVVLKMNITLIQYFIATLYRVVIGGFSGAVLGICCGLLMTWSRWANSALDPLIEALRPVPAIALIPFFILWFGIGDLGKFVLTGIGGFTVMVVTTVEAVKHLAPVYAMAAQTLGAKRLDVYRTIVLPGIAPALISGIRVTVALSFALVIAAEFMGAQTGLGYMVMMARRTLQTDALLLGIIIIGLTSWAMDRLVRVVGDHLTRWEVRSEQ